VSELPPDAAARGVRVLPAIVGPTAAGKSAVALALARAAGAALVSADSRQLYRGFDVGTAKPTAAERGEVSHYGVDVADPAERWSAARWADACEGWVADADARGTPPLLVGGTGLYLRALAAPLFAEPALDPARRAALAAALAPMPLGELRRWVAVLDPARAHLQRTQLLRAAEVALLTGERISTLHARLARPPRFAVRYLVVDPGPVLADRIAARVDAMLDAGWLDEVRALAATVPRDAPAWRASGYGTWRAHLDGALSFRAARERVVIETRQYAKRQRTWLRHQLGDAPVLRVDPGEPDAGAAALAWWNAAGAGAVPGAEPLPFPVPCEDAA
jgi:tRNA dimethylallyltransferase